MAEPGCGPGPIVVERQPEKGVLSEEQLREWLVRERDYWRGRNANPRRLIDCCAQGTQILLEDAIQQVIDVLGPLREPDEIVPVIDHYLGAGWTKSLAEALRKPIMGEPT